jgi:hypothetical protein
MAGPLEELGKAVGRAFAGLAKSLIGGLQFLYKFIVAEWKTAQQMVNPVVREFTLNLYDEIARSFQAGSPDKEYAERARKAMDSYLEFIRRMGEKIKEGKGHQEAVLGAAVDVAISAVTAQTVSEGAATAADSVHPLRRIGLPDMVRSIIGTIGLMAVVGAITKMPLENSVLRPLGYAVNELYPTADLSWGEVKQLRSMGHIDLDKFLFYAKRTGIDEEQARLLDVILTTVPAERMLIRMLPRRGISEESFEKWLRWYGYSDEFVRGFKSLALNPLTRYETRIVWEIKGMDDERIRQMLRENGYRDDVLDDMVDYVKGFTARTERMMPARWLAELYARGRLTREAARSRMAEIVRPEVADALLFRGDVYKEVLAARSSGRVVEEGKDLTRSDVLKLYGIEQITRDVALDMLRDLGYSENEANYLLAIEDYKKRVEPRELSAGQILQSYRYGLIARDEAKAELLGIGYAEKAAERLLQLEDVRLKAKRFERPRERDLPVTTVLKACGMGVIEWEDMVDYLKFLGYDKWEIPVLLAVNVDKLGFESEDEALAFIERMKEEAAKAKQEMS